MLSFATEFPVLHEADRVSFLNTAFQWVFDSPHSAFEPELISIPNDVEDHSYKFGSEEIDIVHARSEHDELTGFRHINSASDIEWTTTAVFSKSQISTWIGIRTYHESEHPAVRLPAAKKPVLVRSMLDVMGSGRDGSIIASPTPLLMTNEQVDLTANIIMGDDGCQLPVVYVSCTFDGRHLVDTFALASDLAGMAHVIVEPNRLFSRQLQITVDSQNTYGGAVGIYWPESSGRRSFFVPRDYENALTMKRAIIEEVRSALLNRRPMRRCSWAAIRELNSRDLLNRLREGGSNNFEEYAKIFDQEIESKQSQIDEADQEIARLKSELRIYEARGAKTSAISITTGNEVDLYPGEIKSVIIEALQSACSTVQPGSRRQDVLSEVARMNEPPAQAKQGRDRLKELLRNYRSMDKSTRKGLEELGFSISEDGKHFKLVYHDDDRYTFALPKSGGDHRGGLNSASDIGKRIF